MGYFRAILKSEEISLRALQCTEELVTVNPGCYTAWHWRRKCIYELKDPKLWEEEVHIMNQIGFKHEKNY